MPGDIALAMPVCTPIQRPRGTSVGTHGQCEQPIGVAQDTIALGG